LEKGVASMQGTELKLAKGDWVSHPRMPEWGYGKVLEQIGDSKGRVFFLLAGEKKLSWKHARLDVIENDKASQAALNEQLVEFKLNLARDVLTCAELNRGVICTPCESFGSKCELCESGSSIVRLYSLSHKGRMCLCDPCRDKIMLETRDRAEIEASITEMESRGKKDAAARAKKKKKPEPARKRR
jgi:hypothetical protein